MSAIKDLMEVEAEGARIIKEAEMQAERIVKEARAKAEQLVRAAEKDETVMNELTFASEARMSEERKKIVEEFEKLARRQEEACIKNKDAAVKLVINSVLGVDYER